MTETMQAQVVVHAQTPDMLTGLRAAFQDKVSSILFGEGFNLKRQPPPPVIGLDHSEYEGNLRACFASLAPRHSPYPKRCCERTKARPVSGWPLAPLPFPSLLHNGPRGQVVAWPRVNQPHLTGPRRFEGGSRPGEKGKCRFLSRPKLLSPWSVSSFVDR
jgi:hypothetical protein